MTDHNLGEQVLKETKIKDKDGKEKNIGDIAKSSWGVPPTGDAAKQQKKQEKPLEQQIQENRAPEKAPPPADQHEAVHSRGGAEQARAAVERSLKERGQQQGHERGQEQGREQAGDQKRERAESRSEKTTPSDGERQEQLVEASKRIKQLNNEMHKPGGPLANSDLELIGFDKAGRLLLIHRDQAGKVDGKYLVDHESGQIVAKTKAGQLDKWDKSPDYDRKEREHGNRPKDWHSESHHGANVWKDKQGHVREVNRPNGDNISVSLDANGKPSEINISYAAKDGKSGRVEQFKLAPNGDVVVQSQGIREAWQKIRDSAQKAEMLDDGSLRLQLKENERRTLGSDGSSIESKLINGQWLNTQVADAYGDRREYKWDEKTNKPTEITITIADTKSSDTYRPGGSIHGVQQDFWYKYPHDPKDQGKGQKFQIDSDGSLKQFVKASEFILSKPDGSIVRTAGNETTVLRQPFKVNPQSQQDDNLMSLTENLVPEVDRQQPA